MNAWLAEFGARIVLGLVLAASISGGAALYHRHVFNQGVAQEKIRRDKLDAAATIATSTELARLNGLLRATQLELNQALFDVSAKEKELNDEKATSAAYQLRLAAGTDRMRVRATCPAASADPAGQANGSAAGHVDQGAETEVDLAPGAAIAIDQLRAGYNEAVIRIDACIAAYDTVREAVNRAVR